MSQPSAAAPNRASASALSSWRARARSISGLILFTFVLTHLLNHALGLVSIEVMDAVRTYRVAIWRSPPGTLLFYGALGVHIILAFYLVARQRTWRMSFWQLVQIGFGLAIPVILFRHIIGTRMVHELFGVSDNYADYALWVMWPGEAYNQAALILLVWVHGCIGLHFWLRLKGWYRKAQWGAYALALLVPVLAYAGFSVAGRAVRSQGSFKNPFSPEQFEIIASAFDLAFWGFLAVLALFAAYRLGRLVLDRVRPRVRVNYGDGVSVVTEIGPTLLEISQMFAIPHASVCGGRARCSTCRVRVLDGLEHLPAPDAHEARVLERVGAGPTVRLACQLVPTRDISVGTLLPAKRVLPEDVGSQDKYVWGIEQEVTLMFCDIRGFTGLSEGRLPFDIVFLLNQYLDQMAAAIEDAGGYVDKFMGDGIMAIFGMDQTPEQGARSAVAAAKAMGGVLRVLNRSVASDLPKPLNFGIGLHTGTAILGRIGDAGREQGTGRITALGDTVNVASRLESASKDLGVQLVISASAVKTAGLKFTGASKDKITVRGRKTPISVTTYKHAIDVPLDAE